MTEKELIEQIADIICRANYNSDPKGLKAAVKIAELCKAHYSRLMIPVSERLPESDDILCVIWVIDDYDFAWWYEGTNCWDSPDNGWTEADKVTFWFPLPDDPEAINKALAKPVTA